jgi:Ca2+-binding EF-hand superfamily protein
MLKSKHALLAAMISVAASSAFAQPHNDEDKPRTREEVIAATLERFDRVDVDQDGYLSDAEIADMKSMRPEFHDRHGDKDERADRVKRTGQDGDGHKPGRRQPHPSPEDSFDLADLDGDGYLSFGEFKEILRAHKPHDKPAQAPVE